MALARGPKTHYPKREELVARVEALSAELLHAKAATLEAQDHAANVTKQMETVKAAVVVVEAAC